MVENSVPKGTIKKACTNFTLLKVSEISWDLILRSGVGNISISQCVGKGVNAATLNT